MTRRARRLGAMGPLAILLLLAACDGSNLGWPDLSGTSGAGAGAGFGEAFAQSGGIEYLVAFNCGSNPAGLPDPVVPGQYGTMVNIYNPGNITISVSMRVSLSIPPGSMVTGDISNFVNKNIASVRAMEVDCETIRSDFVGGVSSSFMSGVLVVQSGTPVEVITTYTAGGIDSVDSVQVARIQAR